MNSIPCQCDSSMKIGADLDKMPRYFPPPKFLVQYIVYKSNELFIKSKSKTIFLCTLSNDYLGREDSKFEQSVALLCSSNIDDHQAFEQKLTNIFKTAFGKTNQTHEFLRLE